jgi:hypothetical protein
LVINPSENLELFSKPIRFLFYWVLLKNFVFGLISNND